MENVYKKLVESLSKMTPQQKQEEWDSLKHLNDIGPTIDEFFSMCEIEEKNTVTVRDRDTMEQVTLSIDELDAYFADKFEF